MIILAILSITLWNLHYSAGKTKVSFVNLDTSICVSYHFFYLGLMDYLYGIFKDG